MGLLERAAAFLLVALISPLFAPPLHLWLHDSPDQWERFRGKTIFITGASSGIGKGIALVAAEYGAKLILVSRRSSALASVSSEALKTGATSVQVIAADLGEPEGRKTVMDRIQDSSIDVAILNHIIGEKKSAGYWGDWTKDYANYADNFLRKLFDVNTIAYLMLSMPLIEKLEANSGTLLVVSSGAAKLMTPRTAPYAATKAAVHTFIDSIRQDLKLRSSNVTLITSTLGNVDTPNAVRNTKTQIDHLGWYDVPSTARSILLSVLAQEEHHFYPYGSLFVPIAVRQLMPVTVDALIRNVVAKGFS